MGNKKSNTYMLREMRPRLVDMALISYQKSNGTGKDDLLGFTPADVKAVNKDMYDLGDRIAGYMINTGNRRLANTKKALKAGGSLTWRYSRMGEDNFMMNAREAARIHYIALGRLLDEIMD